MVHLALAASEPFLCLISQCLPMCGTLGLRYHRIRTAFAMAGLISPKPISYMQHNPQYNPYARGPSAYSETTPVASAPLAHPVPHQPVGQFMTNNLSANVGVHEDGKIYALVIDLMDPNTREGALLELSKKREQYDELALVLWYSFGG